MSKSVPTSSDTASDTLSDLSDGTPVPKLGELFERKRRENKWTKEYVAKALLLSVQQIEALENDEYDKLPGTTYVIGYWRSYANLLKIDISKSIKFHKNNLEMSPSAVVLEAGHRRAHNHQENARKRSGLIFLVLSAIFLTGIWYWQNPDDNPLNQWVDNQPNRETNPLPQTGFSKGDDQVISREVTPAILEPEQDDFGALPEPNFSDDVTEGVIDDVSETDVEMGDATTTESVNNEDVQAVSLGQQEQEPENTQIVSPQSNVTENIAENTSVTENVTENIAENIAENTSVTENTTENIAENTSVTENTTENIAENTSITENTTESLADIPLPDSPNRIFFSIEKQSWLDVRDVTGKKLIYRNVNVGESISLKGESPFYVYVGTADGVRVEYLGKPARFKSEYGGTYARFRADKSGIKPYNER